MNTEQDEKIKVPPHNWVESLAKECGVSRTTIINAIRHNHPGRKCSAVRKKYRELYLQ